MTVAFDGVLELGITEMDRDHHRLVSMVNSSWPLPVANVIEHLEEIANEARAHFEREERLMDAVAFTSSSAHRSEHRALEGAIAEKIRRMKSGQRVNIEALIASTVDWLVEHIVTSDRALATFLQGTCLRQS